MYKSAGFMTFEHTKVEDCLYYSLSPLCTVFTIIYLKHIVFLEYIVLQLFYTYPLLLLLVVVVVVVVVIVVVVVVFVFVVITFYA